MIILSKALLEEYIITPLVIRRNSFLKESRVLMFF